MRVRRFLYLVLVLLSAVILWQIIEVRSQPLPSPAPSVSDQPPQEFFLPAAERPNAAEGEALAMAIARKNPFDPKRGQSNSTPELATAPPTHLKVVGVLQDEVIFVDSSQGGQMVYGRKGEAVGPYRVQEVTSTSVTLVYGSGEAAVLSLPEYDKEAEGLRIEITPTRRPAPTSFAEEGKVDKK